MTPIPTKTKNEFFNKQTITTPVLMIVMTLLLVSMTVFDAFIHQSLQIPSFIFMLLLVLVLLYPTKKNKGKNGLQSFIITMHYKVEKYKERKGI